MSFTWCFVLESAKGTVYNEKIRDSRALSFLSCQRTWKILYGGRALLKQSLWVPLYVKKQFLLLITTYPVKRTIYVVSQILRSSYALGGCYFPKRLNKNLEINIPALWMPFSINTIKERTCINLNLMKNFPHFLFSNFFLLILLWRDISTKQLHSTKLLIKYNCNIFL